MDVWGYFHQKEAEFRERCGHVPDGAVFEADDPDGQSGALRARFWLENDVYLDVYEGVEIVDGSYVHRRAYSYALIIDGVHEHSWERDPTHPEMPLHEHHGPERKRFPSDRISFAEAIEQVWELLSSRELAPWSLESADPE
ncbi:MAG TPA: hypothetical protein VHA80_12000 [Solirubrobacterales bacterium]|nr:hypothetical protein [Solirubrobacterales bacterium]